MNINYNDITVDQARSLTASAPAICERVLKNIHYAASEGRSSLEPVLFPKDLSEIVSLHLLQRGFTVLKENVEDGGEILTVSW